MGSGTKDFGLRNYKLKMEDPPQGQQHRHLNNLSNELNESELGVQWVCLLSLDAYPINLKNISFQTWGVMWN